MALNFKGSWDPVTNTPSLSDGTGTVGDVYEIVLSTLAISFPVNLGSGSINFRNGYSIVYTTAGIYVQIAVQYSINLADVYGNGSSGATVLL